MNPNLLQRLRERKLVQWALAYLAGAWVLLQVFGELRDNFGWAPVTGQMLTVLLAVGFLAVLVLAWYHGEKGHQRVTGVEVLMLSGILVVAGVAVAAVRDDGTAPASPEEARSAQSVTGSTIAGQVSVPWYGSAVLDLPFTGGQERRPLTATGACSWRGRGHPARRRDLAEHGLKGR